MKKAKRWQGGTLGGVHLRREKKNETFTGQREVAIRYNSSRRTFGCKAAAGKRKVSGGRKIRRAAPRDKTRAPNEGRGKGKPLKRGKKSLGVG